MKISPLSYYVHLFRKMSTTSGPTLDAPGGGRPRKASVATRKLSARMDSEVADAFRLFDTVSKSINLKLNIYPTI